MMSCNKVRIAIDESDLPELIPFAVEAHIEKCKACHGFAEERTGLRRLLGSSGRVSAPGNFDMKLKAQLASRKAARTKFGWLTISKLATAAVAALTLVVGIQIWNRDEPQIPRVDPGAREQLGTVPRGGDSGGLETFVQPQPATEVAAASPASRGIESRRVPGRRSVSAQPIVVESDEGALLLVQGQHGELELQVPAVSVGAQPLLYVSSGSETVRSLRTSF